MVDGAAICAACRITRPFDALLAVTARATGDVRYVCRPFVSAEHIPGRRPCFRVAVRTADLDTIALASDPAGALA